MLQAMIDGQRDPKALAEMAHGSMRRKIPQLRQALTGHFADHHAFICATMLRRIDALAADIAGLDIRIEKMIAPFAQAVQKLDEITGIGVRSAQEIIAEIGVDMAAFPTAAHLVSWAKFCPIDAQSAGKKKGNSTGKGNPWLAGTLGEIVAGLSRTNTFLGERYRRLARRRGKKRAIVAVANSVLTIISFAMRPTAPGAGRYYRPGPALLRKLGLSSEGSLRNLPASSHLRMIDWSAHRDEELLQPMIRHEAPAATGARARSGCLGSAVGAPGDRQRDREALRAERPARGRLGSRRSGACWRPWR